MSLVANFLWCIAVELLLSKTKWNLNSVSSSMKLLNIIVPMSCPCHVLMSFIKQIPTALQKIYF